MILVTGGTGFIGQALVRHLVESGRQVRILIRPSSKSPRIPVGIPVEVAVSSLNDQRGLRAAMVGVDTVYHLAGVERRGVEADLLEVEVQGTSNVIKSAVQAGIDRFFFLSHLGADRASAYPLLKVKAIAEENIRRSGLDYSIFRTALVFGPNDGFTTSIAQLLYGIPFVFFVPGDGNQLIQPIWVEDLAVCLSWALDDDNTRNRNFDIGGPEFLSFNEVLNTVISVLGINRLITPISPPILRLITVILEYLLPNSPVSVYWLDYLSTNRTCSLDTLPRVFNLLPSRFSQRLEYLQDRNWRRELFRSFSRRGR
jgi:NADH dehydrogenase